MPKLLFFLLTIFFSGASSATDLRFSHLGIEQGGVDVLTQDNYGFLWIGTSNGLLRYDGKALKPYRNVPDKPGSLPEDTVIALHYGKDGRLWVGTSENGASYYNYQTGTFTRVDANVIGERVYRFYDDASGRGVYAQTTAGLFFIGLNNQARLVLSTSYSEQVLGIHSDKAGTHAILETGQRLTLGQYPDKPEIYQIIPKTLIQYWQPQFCPQLIRESTYAGGGSGLFYCVQDGSVTDANKLNQALFRAGIQAAQLQVYDLVEDSSGTIWMSSDLGLLQVVGERVNTINSPAFDLRNLSSNRLSSLFAGQKNTLFIGTQDQGLNILDLNDNGIHFFSALPVDPANGRQVDTEQRVTACQAEGEAEGPVKWSTLQDTEGGFWVGRHDGIAYRPAGSGHFKMASQLSAGALGDLCSIQALAEAGGRIWIGTRDGLISYHKRSDTVQKHTLRYIEDQESYDGNVIRTLLHDQRRNSLWIGTDQNGLYRIELGSGNVQSLPTVSDKTDSSGLPHEKIHTLYLDDSHRLWVGSSNGLALWDEDTGSFKLIGATDDPATLSDADVYSIHQPDQNTLWVGTANGLNLFHTDSFRVSRRLFERDGLPDATIYGLTPDGYGYYWLTTANGLSRFDSKTHHFSNHYPQHHSQADTSDTNTFYKRASGLLYLSGLDGFSVVNPEVFANEEQSHLPVITRIDNLDAQNKKTALTQLFGADSDQLVQTLARNIRMNFTYPFFGDTDLLQSEYRLLPTDSSWSRVEPDTSHVDFADLKPDAYEFQLRANLVGNQITSFRFNIEPHFWETSWFRALALLVLLISTVFLTIYCYRFWGKFSADKMTRQHYRIVEHELRPHLYEANKQLQSLMDSPRLTIKDKQTIRFSVMPLINKSIDFIAELRTLVDLRRTVKQPRQLYLLEDVLDEVLLFFHDQQQRIVIEEVDDINILTHQDAVYLLVKNLISNAIKYSPDGGSVCVNARAEGKALFIECIDQGIGISKDKRKAIYEPYKRFAGEYKNINGQGIGLAIVRFIVHTYQGSIQIEDNQPKGSRFIVRLNGVVAYEQ